MTAIVEDMASAILDCAVPIAVTRFAAPAMVNGKPQSRPIESVFTANAVVVPLTSKEQLMLPEGQRSQGRRAVFSSTVLRTEETATGTLADRFDYLGVVYEIDKIDDYQDLGNFSRYEAVRVNR